MQMVFKSSNVEIYIWNVENNKYAAETDSDPTASLYLLVRSDLELQ